MRDLTTAIMHIARSIDMPITHEGAEQYARMYAAGRTAPYRTAALKAWLQDGGRR